MPRSIENYVQEIGRAGRNGLLARCHMFLNNEDFYALRRITLSDLLDSQSCFRLTNRILSQAKRDLLKIVQPDFNQKKNKKRKKADLDNEEEFGENIIDIFEHESMLEEYYDDQGKIRTDEVMDGLPFYISLPVKDVINNLDLKKEVVMTMLN